MTLAPIDAADRQEIADVLVRYATGIDRRDWDLFRTCFTDDCVADYGDIGVWHGADEITAWMEEAHRDVRPHAAPHHQPGGDADRRRRRQARCYVDAIVMGADNQSGVRAVGFYDDELVHTDDGWKIAAAASRRCSSSGHRQTPPSS